MIIRTYRCNECSEVFEVTCESADGDPDCPYCTKEMVWQPTRFAIGTTKGKAVDMTQRILENDYGLTDFKDNLREGDVAAKEPVRPKDEREAIAAVEEQARQMTATPDALRGKPGAFWAGGSGGAPVNVAAAALADAKASKGQHVGMEMFNEAAKRGHLPTHYRLVDEHGRQITRRIA
jgi:DNA-directed RNA polymerase subunit RPC12/RpoP